MITAKSLRVFLIGAVLTFSMVVIPHLNIRQQPLAIPRFKGVDPLEKIKPALLKKQNAFSIQKEIIPPAFAGEDYDQASAYALVDPDSGRVVASKNLTKKLPMASLTKVMTAVVALDLADPHEVFTVSSKAENQVPSKVQLKAGEKYRLETLLNFLLMTSANDSAMAIKEGIDNKYNGEVFIEAMNFKAKALGLKNSHFTNPAGLDNPNHYSTAEDLSILSAYAMKEYPLIAQITAKEYEDMTGGVDLRFYLNNWNGLLGTYPGVSGIKIGNTGNAGHTTIVLAEREDKRLLAILLGAPGVLERDLWTSQLLDFGFQKEANLQPVKLTESRLRQKYASWVYN